MREEEEDQGGDGEAVGSPPSPSSWLDLPPSSFSASPDWSTVSLLYLCTVLPAGVGALAPSRPRRRRLLRPQAVVVTAVAALAASAALRGLSSVLGAAPDVALPAVRMLLWAAACDSAWRAVRGAFLLLDGGDDRGDVDLGQMASLGGAAAVAVATFFASSCSSSWWTLLLRGLVSSLVSAAAITHARLDDAPTAVTQVKKNKT